MMSKKLLIFRSILIILYPSFLIASCSGNDQINKGQSTLSIDPVTPTIPSDIQPTTNANNLTIPDQVVFWIDPSINIQSNFPGWELIKDNLVEKKEIADFWIESAPSSDGFGMLLRESYFIVSVPFTSSVKNIELSSLKKIWSGDSIEFDNIRLWVSPNEFEQLTIFFRQAPLENVIISESEPDSCKLTECWKITKFENSDPKWRIISIDGFSLLSHDFDPELYPFVERIFLQKNPISNQEITFPFEINVQSNFDPAHLTSLLMTGTTALVRNTAFQIEENGLDFPLENIQDLLDSVDLIHISNEVPFYSKCPSAVPVRKEMRFCSDPKYMEILKMMGVDIVELTGNHLLDWGPDAFLETLSLYRENNIKTFGGGATFEMARKPLIIENNGNKLAFIGCNVPGPENDWVSDERPGSLPCDLDELENTVRDLRKQGYIPIFTFQHYEFDYFQVNNLLKQDFWRMAEAGAVIVSGSQAHFPQGIDFVGSSFVHYGLGNFLFDQMYKYWGMASIDIHYFYENKYINTLQIPIKNEN